MVVVVVVDGVVGAGVVVVVVVVVVVEGDVGFSVVLVVVVVVEAVGVDGVVVVEVVVVFNEEGDGVCRTGNCVGGELGNFKGAEVLVTWCVPLAVGQSSTRLIVDDGDDRVDKLDVTFASVTDDTVGGTVELELSEPTFVDCV